MLGCPIQYVYSNMQQIHTRHIHIHTYTYIYIIYIIVYNYIIYIIFRPGRPTNIIQYHHRPSGNGMASLGSLRFSPSDVNQNAHEAHQQ